MRNATDQVFQTAIIFCLENPEMRFIFLRWRPGNRFTPKADMCSAALGNVPFVPVADIDHYSITSPATMTRPMTE